jgi:hypothetical protein
MIDAQSRNLLLKLSSQLEAEMMICRVKAIAAKEGWAGNEQNGLYRRKVDVEADTFQIRAKILARSADTILSTTLPQPRPL